MSNVKNSYIEIQEQEAVQQIVVNGQPLEMKLTSYLGLCSNCKAVLYSIPPGTPVTALMSQLDQRALKQGDFGYCPACGAKVNWYPTITVKNYTILDKQGE